MKILIDFNTVSIFYVSFLSLFIFHVLDYHQNITTKSLSSLSSSSFNQSIQPFPTFDQYPIHSDEKYITFFTHSGFQNQLIQVENSLLLAWYLNRTLILPKAVLGESFGWNRFDKLQQHHILRETNQCVKKTKCPKRFALVSFDQLVDLSWARQHVRIIDREQSDLGWLQRRFGIETKDDVHSEVGTFVNGDILFFKDQSRYDWRFFDTSTKHRFMGRYNGSLEISALKKRKEKLIHFTSLFGTGKFSIKDPSAQHFFNQLKQTITYKHPAVLKMADIIIDRLGGAGNFVGAHLRTADGLFVEAIPENINNIIQKINVSSSFNEPPSLSTCVSLAKQNQTTLVFLATDAVRPRDNPIFHALWHHAPCTFTLNDILDPKDPLWIYMDQYKTRHSGESMRKYLIPLVDAWVAGRGRSFIGSKGSTFSGYIRRLHQTFWSL
ncbi:hypothetical protein G6F70_005738 [Rhizopus microsporus]|uniref:Peptide-O-fucosyltransferase n=1 Tax=Rhizopus azygosporus TaxID=86630 RepID=A0A367JI16_RHIAZ|nr:hypothetical protein G6F71_008098 [Rhizopus microsporus]RCH89583.1 hypothetical protein CU097_009274 [Rhizopus azygosporus]KAG1198517.1 hypothetical protein G6F70_005738 [Rhizopus microsporus]KAG1206000.1 hypothetical protein G6F69_009142 [Rhizopus microsporus]KAG1228240.1 hypothetical protein G6F67_007947 [Rhizopus microsporus]